MGIRILLADNYQIARQGLRALLEREPDLKVVAEAENGQTAVRLTRELSPEVVILDLSLPDLQGVELVRQVVTAAPGVRVVAVSMYADRRFAVSILKAGALGYLLKDCAFEDLVRAIRTVVAYKNFISPGLSELVFQDYMEAIRESEMRFRAIFEGANLGIALLDRDGRIIESNPALQNLLGYGQEELRQQLFTSFIQPADEAKCKGLFKEPVAGKRDVIQMEKQYVRQDGQVAWGHLTVSRFRGAKEEDQFAIGMLADINSRKQAEAEILNYQRELSLMEERERRRLSTELHDHVSQILAMAQIKLGALRESASSTGLAAPIDEVRRLIEQTIQYTRSLTFELSPPLLYDLGFGAAVEWLAEMMQEQSGLRIEVRVDNGPKPLDEEIKVLLFHAVRELLVNVIKHAQATRVRIAIDGKVTDLHIRVEDNGVGLTVPLDASVGARGFGLFSIRERLKYMGGHLEVESGPGQGTRVTLVVPLKQQ